MRTAGKGEETADQILQTILDITPTAVVEVNYDGRIVFANREAEALFGYSHNELVDEPVERLVPPRIRDAHRIHVKNFCQAPQTCLMGRGSHLFAFHRDGSEIPVALTLKPLELAAEKLVLAFLRDLREEKPTEEAFGQREHWYRTLVNLSPVGIFHTDSAGNYLEVNEKWCSISGVSLDGALADGWMKCLHPEDKEWVAQTWNATVSRGVRFRSEHRMVRADGSVATVSVDAFPRLRDTGTVVGYVGTVTDVTEHKRMQEAERESARLLEIFFQYTHTQIAFLDRDFTFIRVNEAYARADNHDVSGFPGRSHLDARPSDVRQILEEVRDTKRPFRAFAQPFEYSGHSEGGISYRDVQVVPAFDDAGEVEMIVLSLDDVTARERAVKALRRGEEHVG